MIDERRSVARAILISPSQKILLIRIRRPESNDPLWITPGGRLADGESDEAGLSRELFEELGLEQFSIGPLVCVQDHTFVWGKTRVRQVERFYVVQTEEFDPRMSDEVEQEMVEEFRWRTVDEIAASGEVFAPRSLGQIVQKFLKDGPPDRPVEIEVLVD